MSRTAYGIARRAKKEGFEQKRDSSILAKIYGADSYGNYRLLKEYLTWADTAQAPEDERVPEGYATPEECALNVINEIDAEIQRLKTSHKIRMNFAAEKTRPKSFGRISPNLNGWTVCFGMKLV
jgi:hypothetical protein